MRAYSSLLLVVLCFVLLGAAGKKTAEVDKSGPFFRRIEILGWGPDSKVLLYREETEAAGALTSRAVVLDSEKGKLLKEHALQDPADAPDIISVRENNLRVLMEHEHYEPAPATSFFIGAGKRGFLSPNGQYLLFAKMQFSPLAGKLGLQSLAIHFFLTDLRNEQEWNVAQMVLESIDGEHPLTLESISSVSLLDLRWGPDHNVAAAVLEEKRKDFVIQGVFPLRLSNLPDLTSQAVAQAPKVTLDLQEAPAPPASGESAPAPLHPSKTPVPSPATPPDLRAYYEPEGGQTNDLAWEKGLRSVSPDQQLEAIYSSYRTCKDLALSAQVTLLDTKKGDLHEIPLASTLDPKGISFDWGKKELKILFMGEPLRSIHLSGKILQSPRQSPRAFSIQLGSFASQEKAAQQVKELCAIGLPAYSLAYGDTKSGEPRFRVRLGRFLSEEKAKQYAHEVLKSQFPKYLVTKF